MRNLQSIEAGRSMHERGMQEQKKLDWMMNIHPIAALVAVHNILITPEPPELPSIESAYDVLVNRLQLPEALDLEKGLAERLLDKVWAGTILNSKPIDHQRMWPIAFEIIARPIDPTEIGEQVA